MNTASAFAMSSPVPTAFGRASRRRTGAPRGPPAAHVPAAKVVWVLLLRHQGVDRARARRHLSQVKPRAPVPPSRALPGELRGETGPPCRVLQPPPAGTSQTVGRPACPVVA